VRKSLAVAALGLSLSLAGCKSRVGESKLDRAKALTREEPAAALEELDRVLAEGADRSEVTKAKAAAHQRLGQLDEAERLLRSVLAEKPDDQETLQQLANVSVAQGRLDEARRFLTLAIRHRPPHVPTLLLFATLAKSPADGEAGLQAFTLLETDSYRTFRRSAEYAVGYAALLMAKGEGQLALDAWLKKHAQSRAYDPRLSLLMADSFAKLEKPELSLWLLARASSSPSAGKDVHEALAERALGMGDVRLGELALSRMGGDLNRTPNVLLLEARLLELQDQGLEATKLTKRALDAVPEERAAQKVAYALAHARALAKEGLYDQARTVLKEVLERDPKHGRARILLGAIEIQAGHPEAVDPLVAELLADPRYQPQSQTLIVRARLAKKDPQGAKTAARRFFEEDPSARHGRLLLAQTLAEVGERRPALELLDQAPADQAMTPAVIRMRIQLSGLVRGPAKTEALIREYLKAGVDLPDVKRALAESLASQKRLPEAEAIFRELARDDPNALEQVAQLEREQGRLDAALATLQTLVTAHPTSHSAWLLLALMKKEAGDRAGATSAYEAALRQSPNDPIALNNLALLLLEQDATKGRAPGLARQAVAALPDNPALEDTLGWALVEAGEEKQLAEALELLARSTPALGTPEAAFHYGVGLARAKRAGEAKKQLAKAIATAPANPAPAWRPRAELALASLP
jgi:tetratricopeptide (TPR) repeat protein